MNIYQRNFFLVYLILLQSKPIWSFKGTLHWKIYSCRLCWGSHQVLRCWLWVTREVRSVSADCRNVSGGCFTGIGLLGSCSGVHWPLRNSVALQRHCNGCWKPCTSAPCDPAWGLQLQGEHSLTNTATQPTKLLTALWCDDSNSHTKTYMYTYIELC